MFIDNCNYQRFLNLYEKHIEPVAETFAWCLMKNYFHLLVRIKGFDEILPYTQPLSGTSSADRVSPALTLTVVSDSISGDRK
ncbi:MAG: hypothetical protein HY738_03385 [Bacteroidia bacterium]|nr:hypothetical protein [Bacteroidia bacterium]